MLNKLILFCFIFIVSNNSLSQTEDTFHYYQKQKYYYIDNSIKVSFKTNLVQLFSNDTLKVEIKIQNISSRNIYFFEGYQIHYIGFRKVKEGIYIDYGDDFTSNIEYPVKMIKVKPDSLVIFKFKYPYQELIEKSFTTSFSIIFGIGYISDLQQILDFVNDDPEEYFFENLNDSIVISSIALEFLLKRMSASLGVRLWL